MSILLWLLLEILGPVLVEIFFGVLVAPVRTFDEDRAAGPAAAVWFTFVGMLLGGCSCLIAQERFMRPGPFPGASLLVLPLLGAITMEGWGQIRIQRGSSLSHVATWYGGGSFGLGYAAARLLGLAFLADVKAL